MITWTTACQASLSFTISQSWLKLMCIESVMPSNQLVLCLPLFLLSSIFPSIRVFSSELALCIRWPKYRSFSISPSNVYSGLISFRIDGLISLLSRGLSGIFSSTTTRKHQFLGTQPSLWSNSHLHTSCCCSISKLCPTLCNPLDCNTPGFPVLHYLLGFAIFMACHVGVLIMPSLFI